jgi:hypothetical protein
LTSFVGVKFQVFEREASALLVSSARTLDADDLTFEIRRRFDFGPAYKNHRRITGKPAEHHHILVALRHRDHQVSRHDRQIHFISHQSHWCNRAGGSNDFRIDTLFRKESGLKAWRSSQN